MESSILPTSYCAPAYFFVSQITNSTLRNYTETFLNAHNITNEKWYVDDITK